MKRAHRRLHLMLWLALAPAVAAATAFALTLRDEPARDALPPAIITGEAD